MSKKRSTSRRKSQRATTTAADVTPFTVTLTITCPFCGERCGVGHGGLSGIPGVMHDQPPCETFNRLEPADFLKAVREVLVPKAQA